SICTTSIKFDQQIHDSTEQSCTQSICSTEPSRLHAISTAPSKLHTASADTTRVAWFPSGIRSYVFWEPSETCATLFDSPDSAFSSAATVNPHASCIKPNDFQWHAKYSR
ncbi:hypothetical protein scyTo_0021837, partial [Scyliorhinus torazame]|nr:hypothetical protein [Scyliorhinus torazame]